jgi:membrane protease YdiL (CAAX protease family)
MTAGPVDRSRLGVYFPVTFVVSWAFWGAATVISEGSTSPTADIAGSALFYLGVFAPALVALALTRWNEGRAGVANLIHPIFAWPRAVRWYLFAAGYLAAVKLAAAVLYRLTVGDWPAFGSDAWYILLVAMVFSTPVQAGEEIGWRGYALPRLAGRVGLGWASVIVGAVWAAWHLPLFFLPEADTFGQSFVAYLLVVSALSVAMAWLFWRTGSLLVTMLMHAAINNTKDIVPTPATAPGSPFRLQASFLGWLVLLLLWVGAVLFLFRMRGARLEPARAPTGS